MTIQFETIEFDKQAPIIGRGRFGKVLRGFHYGDVAVKVYTMEHISDASKKAEEFKLEVSAYKVGLLILKFQQKNRVVHLDSIRNEK